MKSANVQSRKQYCKLVLGAAVVFAAVSPGVSAFAQYAPSQGQNGDNGQYQGQGQNDVNPSGRVGRLAYLQGNVSFEPNGVNNWSAAEPNYPVATGDRVYTDYSARTEVSVGSMVARMSGGTDLTMTNLTDQIVQMGLAQGSLHVRVYDMEQGNQVEIDTPNGAVTLNQPGDVRINVPANQGATEVIVEQGNVQVSGPDMSENINQGNAVELTGTNPVYVNAVQFPGGDQFDGWSRERDRHVIDSRSAQYVSRDTPGFDDLDDYGSWTPNTEYGPVWYPRDVDAGYVPYQNGHWIWVDPYGWTWVDAAPWGYAPFHYGRWAYVGTRWGWIPGPVRVRPYWAPALVAFAGGGGFSVGFGGGGFAAWFPLGVGEPYVPSYHCGPGYVRNVNVTNINITVIHNTTIVNNYNTFVHNSNNYTNIRNTTVNYQNRERGFTAVNGRAFAGGQPVHNNIARVTPETIRASTVIAHPSLMPTRQAVVPHPVSAVAVSAARPTLINRSGRQQVAAPGARPVAVPYKPLPASQQRVNSVAAAPAAPMQGNRGQQQGIAARPGTPAAPVATAPGRPIAVPAPGQRSAPLPAPAQNGRPQPVGQPAPQPVARPAAPVARTFAPPPAAPGRPAPVAPVSQPRPLVNRSAPPVAQPTFQQQRPAMRADPGRPLEPQQRNNLRQGMPAGRPQDTEPLPHQQQAMRPAPQAARPAPEPRPAPAARPAPQPQGRPEPRGGQHR